MTAELLPALREQYGVPAVKLSEAVTRADMLVPGDPPVRARVHRAADQDGPRPGILSIHGGGYVLGSCAEDDLLFDRWCTAHGVVGVSVDYRLAPETPYPGPLEDCHLVLAWAYEHRDELGIDGHALGVRGTSAGGGLAAGLALLARDRGEVPVAFQLLECPMLDDRQVTPSSRMEGLPVWSRESNRFGWQCYLGALYGTDEVPPYAAAARATDLVGLPPAFLSIGSVDGFRDEVIDYATRLTRAGVPTELHVYAGAPHGYQMAVRSSIARQARHDIAAWLDRRLRRQAVPVAGGPSHG